MSKNISRIIIKKSPRLFGVTLYYLHWFSFGGPTVQNFWLQLLYNVGRAVNTERRLVLTVGWIVDKWWIFSVLK